MVSAESKVISFCFHPGHGGHCEARVLPGASPCWKSNSLHQQQDTECGRQAPDLYKAITDYAPRSPLLGGCEAELRHHDSKEDPGFISACVAYIKVLAPFSYLICYFTLYQYSEHSLLPASTCSKSRPCRGLLPHTAFCATDTAGDSAQSSFHPGTEPCRTQ